VRQLKCCTLFISGQAVNEATAATSDSRADAVNRHRVADLSPSRPAPGTSSRQRERLKQQQASGSLRRKAAQSGAIIHDEEDVFVVGPPGGMFQSTSDPDVSIYIPPTAVNQTITLTMQVTL